MTEFLKLNINSVFILFMMGFGVGCQSSSSGLNVTSEKSLALEKFFNSNFEQWLSLSPETQTYLGRLTNSDKLDSYSRLAEEKKTFLAKESLEGLKAFNYKKLSLEDKLSYDLFKIQMEAVIEDFQWRDFRYPIEQLNGLQALLPSFMMNLHKVIDGKGLDDYLARLSEFPRVFGETIENMKSAEKNGVVPPRFVFDKVLGDSRNILKGRPFDKSKKDSPLYRDFKQKMAGLKNISSTQKKNWELALNKTLTESVGPGYRDLIQFLEGQKKRSDNKDGVWKFPRGKDYYKYRLRRMTTTDYSPDFIHRLGLINVDRIHREMEIIKNKVGFKGSLQKFFEFMQSNPKFYYTQDSAGRLQYLKLANRYIDELRPKLKDMFTVFPKAKIEVKAVEDYRENSAGTAFYEGASLDGRRPGRYYVNLSNLKALPTWEAESLAFHEAIPGHHMQISISQEQKSLPLFRRYSSGYTAYVEGWALYAEKAPLEVGQFQDPYSNFGRLSNELYRACRLVVDTGIHWKKWTRKQAVDYMNKNTPSDPKENYRQIERYIVMPGQATAYMVGMLKILELRRKAQSALGAQFDIKKFHDWVLKGGAMPLDLLEKTIQSRVSTLGGRWPEGVEPQSKALRTKN